MSPSPFGCGLGPWRYSLSRPQRVYFCYGPVTRSLPWGDLVDRLQSFSFHHLCYPNYGALTSTPAGLSPAEHASLHWTHDGTCVYLIMPTSNTACFQIFLNVLSRKFASQDILLVLDGAPNHRCKVLALPNNISLLFLPPYSPELNPKENLWDEIREKLFKNYALKSIDAVRAKLKQAILYIERLS